MKNIILPFVLLFFVACGGSESDSDTVSENNNKSVASADTKKAEEKCKYGAPVAIFSDQYEQIVKQSFEANGQKGIETVEFKDGKVLELYQSGCNEIRQEYRFAISGNFKDKDDRFWFEEAIRQMSEIGQLDEKYAVIGMWVGALQTMSDKMTIGQFSEAEPDTFIMVDRLVEQESALVIIVLERRI